MLLSYLKKTTKRDTTSLKTVISYTNSINQFSIIVNTFQQKNRRVQPLGKNDGVITEGYVIKRRSSES